MIFYLDIEYNIVHNEHMIFYLDIEYNDDDNNLVYVIKKYKIIFFTYIINKYLFIIDGLDIFMSNEFETILKSLLSSILFIFFFNLVLFFILIHIYTKTVLEIYTVKILFL